MPIDVFDPDRQPPCDCMDIMFSQQLPYFDAEGNIVIIDDAVWCPECGAFKVSPHYPLGRP